MRTFFNDFKSTPNPNTANISDANTFVLTFSQASTAIVTSGKWDKNYIGEDSKISATSPKAVDIKELKLSNLPNRILQKSLLHSPAEATHIYTLIETLNHKNSKVETLDLSNNQFDTLSLLVLIKAVENQFNRGMVKLKKIKIDNHQPNLTKSIKDSLIHLSNKYKIQFEFVTKIPKQDNTSQLS